MKNILVLSCGTRNKVIQYFKKALTTEDGTRIGRVIATDMSRVAPAIYEADAHYIVPRMTADGYIDVIFDICRKENICAVLSLIDPELSLLARHEADFAAIGVRVVGSSYALCEMSLDKMQMYRWLTDHGYRTARSYIDKEVFYADLDRGLIQSPVFVKPIRGSASIAISKVSDRETLELLFAHDSNLMIQEYMKGQEIGTDVYIDMVSGEVVSIFTKKKLVMRAGETDKAVSFKDEKLFELIRRFVGEAGYRGQIDIDIFEVDGVYYISEVNPRFGGGYPHAYECGCDHMTMIANNLGGIANYCSIGNYESNVFMMKYSEIMLYRE
jgi:carbamoyl-phosphate synthase large subunit